MKGIYILTNTVNGKQYVGMDSNLPSRARDHFNGHSKCAAITAAIKKHGKDNFTVEIIPYPHISSDALREVERWHIAKRCTLYPHGYNLTPGGDFNPMNIPEVRKRHIEAVNTPEHRQKIREINQRNGHFTSERNRNNWQCPEYREKMSKVASKRNKSQWEKKEYREKMQAIANDPATHKKSRETRARNKSKKAKANGQLTLF